MAASVKTVLEDLLVSHNISILEHVVKAMMEHETSKMQYELNDLQGLIVRDNPYSFICTVLLIKLVSFGDCCKDSLLDKDDFLQHVKNSKYYWSICKRSNILKTIQHDKVLKPLNMRVIK